MKSDLTLEVLYRWRWWLCYRLADLNLFSRLLLAGCLAVNVVVVLGVLAYEREITRLGREIAARQPAVLSPERQTENQNRAMLARFQAFLPNAVEAEKMPAAFYKAANEAGIEVDKISTQASSRQASSYLSSGFKLQLRGDREKVERFILLALLDNDALVFKRWSFQSGASRGGMMMGSTIDFELLAKPQ